jgi:hypothetical protein
MTELESGRVKRGRFRVPGRPSWRPSEFFGSQYTAKSYFIVSKSRSQYFTRCPVTQGRFAKTTTV